MKISVTQILFFCIQVFLKLQTFNCEQKDEQCDKQIQSILAQQNILFKCDINVIRVDGDQQSKEISLIFKNITPENTMIVMFNFKELILKSLYIENLIIQQQVIVEEQILPFLVIQNNFFVKLEEFLIIGEKEENLASIQVLNNAILQINNIKIEFFNGYYPANKNMQFILKLVNNNETQITNYSFSYNQSDNILMENNNLVGLYLVQNSINITNVDININYVKDMIQQPKDFLLKPLISENQDWNQNQLSITKMNINLSSHLNQFGYIQTVFIYFKYGSVAIGDLNIQNKNFQIEIISFFRLSSFQIQNVNIKDCYFEQNFLLSSVENIKSIFYTDSQNLLLDIANLNVENSFIQQQYLILYINTLDGMLVNISSFRFLNSQWINTMIYISVSTFQQNTIRLNMIMSNSNYRGENSLIYLCAFLIQLSIEAKTHEIFSTINGLIQISHSNIIQVSNSNIQINKITDLNLGMGGLFQFRNILSSVIVSNLKFSSFAQQIFRSQIGGLFQILQCNQVNFKNVTASGLRITGQGSFAFIQSSQILIEQCYFLNFHTEGCGGTFMMTYEKLLIIRNVTISNSTSNLFGGAIYSSFPFGSNSNYFIEGLIINNSYALIGGGFIYNYMQNDYADIQYNQNKAKLFGDDYSLPLSKIQVLKFVEYNPNLAFDLVEIKRSFQQLNNSLSTQINLQNVQIKIKYYLTFNLIMGDRNISYSDLNCEKNSQFLQNTIDNRFYHKQQLQSSPNNLKQNEQASQNQQCKQNLLDLVHQTPSYIQNPTANNKLQQTYQNQSKIDILQNFELNTTKDFYFIHEYKEYYYKQYELSFQLLGVDINLLAYRSKYCEIGQIKVNQGTVDYCTYCNNFKAIKNNSSQSCYKCDPQIFEYCGGNIFFLKPGFYRIFQNNQHYKSYHLNNKSTYINQQEQINQKNLNEQIIFPCTFRPNYCHGGDFDGDKLCVNPHVGPLCLDCLRKSFTSNEIYTRTNSYECCICHTYSLNLLFCILSLIGGIIAIGVFDIIIYFWFRSIQNKVKIKERISAGIHLKFLLFFLQIINVCSFYQSPAFYQFIINFQVYSFNPISNSYTNFVECFLIQQFPNLFSAPYILSMLLSCVPIFFILSYIILKYLILIFIRCLQKVLLKRKKRKNLKKLQEQILLDQQLEESDQEKERIEQLKEIDESKQKYNSFTNLNQDSQLEQSQNFFSEQQDQISLNLNSVSLSQEQKTSEIYLKNRQFTYQLIFFSINVFSPQIIQILIQGVTCATFNGIGSFSNLDLTVNCEDETFLFYYNIIVPILTVYAIIIPTLFASILFQNKNDLKKDKIRFKFGFLFSEYKKQYYYWEFIKYIVKLLITISIYLIIPNNNQIGYPVIAILAIYSSLLLYFQPYKLFEHTLREIYLILSGIFMIICYIFTHILQSNNFTDSNSNFSQSILIFGHIQALFVLIGIVTYFLYYFLFLKIYKKCCKKRQQSIKNE